MERRQGGDRPGRRLQHAARARPEDRRALRLLLLRHRRRQGLQHGVRHQGRAQDSSDAELAALRSAVGVSAKDATTVVFKLNAPNPSFLNQLALWPRRPCARTSSRSTATTGPKPATSSATAPSCSRSGPTTTTSSSSRTRTGTGEAKLSQVTIQIIADDVTAYAAYLAGELDVATVPPANRKEVSTAGSPLNTQLVRSPTWRRRPFSSTPRTSPSTT